MATSVPIPTGDITVGYLTSYILKLFSQIMLKFYISIFSNLKINLREINSLAQKVWNRIEIVHPIQVYRGSHTKFYLAVSISIFLLNMLGKHMFHKGSSAVELITHRDSQLSFIGCVQADLIWIPNWAEHSLGLITCSIISYSHDYPQTDSLKYLRKLLIFILRLIMTLFEWYAKSRGLS